MVRYVLGAVVSLSLGVWGATASVDLGAVDEEQGLVNSQTAHPSDGENEAVECGPAADVRGAKKNWSAEDPTLDVAPATWPDVFFYFNVIDPDVKSAEHVMIEVTVYDDPLLPAGTTLALEYTNLDSTGPADIPNTFFPHRTTHVLQGTDAWASFAWEVTNAGFRTFMQGTSDFRVSVSGGQRLCMDGAAVTVITAEFPVDLACPTADRTTVRLTWRNLGVYEALVLKRDGEVIAVLDTAAVSYEDADVPEGPHAYDLVATAAGESGGPRCEVTVLPDMTGQSVTVDLGETNIEDGLANSHTAPPDGGDGENEPAFCGPPGQEREARRNWGEEDPTPDGTAGETLYPDFCFYFNVTVPEIKGQSEFVLAVTVYDDPSLAGAGLALQYTNQDSTGPGDIPNTFFPLDQPPVRNLEGCGEWVTLEWAIENAGFRSYQQGDSDFRVLCGARLCVDKAALTVGIAEDFPFDLACTVSGATVRLAWRAFRFYDLITVLRDGEVLATLPGNRTSYEDLDVPEGSYEYEVLALLGGVEDGVACEATVEGEAPGEPMFKRGDINQDGKIDIADPIALLGHLFASKPRPACPDSADGNDDGKLDIADAIKVLGHLFAAAGPLPNPFSACGVDEVADTLGECVFPPCEG